MITDYQVQRKDDTVLLGLATESAVLDIVTNDNLLCTCLSLLQHSSEALTSSIMGSFGDFQVTLNVHRDKTVSIYVDGPPFAKDRVQSSAIYTTKDSLRRVIESIVQDGHRTKTGGP